ncbi:MAG: NUDIX domain-containing protein [Ruminococcaceae bacterium]|nr:NUDIX domain-containing protein [Oscillospiraceae bacterium]
MVEMWDAYDRQFNRIETAALERGKAVPDGMYHLVCEIIVKHNDGTYLLMQRDFEKHLGGMWELTAGGSALKGETPIECAVRELREETGIVSCNLQELKRIIHDGHHSLYVEYLCITDWDKNAVILQAGETVDYKWVDKTALLEMGTDALASSRTLEIVKELSI